MFGFFIVQNECDGDDVWSTKAFEIQTQTKSSSDTREEVVVGRLALAAK